MNRDLVVNDEALPFFDISSLESGLRDRSEGMPNDSEYQLLETVGSFYRAIKKRQRDATEIYQPAGEWREHVTNRMPQYDAFQEGQVDRLADLLGNFWRNALGVLVKQYMGYPQLAENSANRTAYAASMAHDLMIWTNLYGEDVTELAIPDVGNPWGYLWRGTLIGSKAMRYHDLKTKIEGMTEDIARPIVAEIGAGYGGLAHFLMRGTEKRVYIDFDLPETLAVAAYHLKKALPHRRVYLHAGGSPEWESIISNNDVILMPNWCIDTIPAASVDVYVNSFSLSEMGRPIVENYLAKIAHSCRGYFLHNNMDRSGVVNEGHERLPASQYPFPRGVFKLLGKHYDMFQRKHSGRDGDYREFLYQRTAAVPHR